MNFVNSIENKTIPSFSGLVQTHTGTKCFTFINYDLYSYDTINNGTILDYNIQFKSGSSVIMGIGNITALSWYQNITNQHIYLVYSTTDNNFGLFIYDIYSMQKTLIQHTGGIVYALKAYSSGTNYMILYAIYNGTKDLTYLLSQSGLTDWSFLNTVTGLCIDEDNLNNPIIIVFNATEISIYNSGTMNGMDFQSPPSSPITSATIFGYGNYIYYSTKDMNNPQNGTLYRVNTETFIRQTIFSYIMNPTSLCHSTQHLFWIEIGAGSSTSEIVKITDPINSSGIQVVEGALTITEDTVTSVTSDTSSSNGYIGVYMHNTNLIDVFGAQGVTGPSAPTWSSNTAETNNNYWTITWNPAIEFNNIVGYQLEVSSTPDFSSNSSLGGSQIYGTSFVISDEIPGIYYYKVRAEDDVGNWGSWSALYTVTYVIPSNTTSSISTQNSTLFGTISGYNIEFIISIFAIQTVWIIRRIKK
jgi:hypothetical protein